MSEFSTKQTRRDLGVGFLAIGVGLVGIPVYVAVRFGSEALLVPYPVVLVALIGMPFLLSGIAILRLKPEN